MKYEYGWWMPDDEIHFIEASFRKRMNDSGEPTYQQKHRDNALQYVKRFDVAVDVGAHIGTWSRDLARRFTRLYAFEPLAEHRECFVKNVDMEKTTLYEYALGHRESRVSLIRGEKTSGDTHIDPSNRKGAVVMKTLDSFNFETINFIKIDAEGYELMILRGGLNTLKRCRPVICIEQKPHNVKFYGLKQYDARDFLIKNGFTYLGRHTDDLVFQYQKIKK